MINLLLALMVFCGSLFATDVDSDGGKKRIRSGRSINNFDDFEEEKAAKKQKKFGSRGAASSIRAGGRTPISTVSKIFDKSKLGLVPSAYLDKQKDIQKEFAESFICNIRYAALQVESDSYFLKMP
ncbi:MAG: hypothetical protein WCN27_02670 [Alphaproteobacteria bacterium]